MSAKRLVCALLLKEADRHLSGWLAWHLSLGIEHVAIIDEGDSDAARQLVQACQDAWPLSWLPVELPDGLPAETRRLELTRRALAHLRHVTRAASQPNGNEDEGDDRDTPDDWVIILDADEYLVPRQTLPDLLRHATDDTAAMALHWKIYGSAGHLVTPPGHVIGNHTWHAPAAFPDHRFTRLMARFDYLPEPESLADPLTFDLPEDWIIRSDGGPYHPEAADLLTAPWEGGSIQHYICAQSHGEAELPPAMRTYYDRNEQPESPRPDALRSMRGLANLMRQDCLAAGLARLKKLASQQMEEKKQDWRQDEARPVLADHAGYETFRCDRIRPETRTAFLLDPQVSPRYSPGQAVLLRSLEGRLLECDSPEQRTLLIGFWQESAPHVLTLKAQDGRPFILGDLPCAFGYACLRLTFDAARQVIYLPHETGQGSIPMEMIPATAEAIALLAPLPPIHDSKGLSVRELLTWMAGRPIIKPVDLQRALLLLAPDSSRHLCLLAPVLEDFLPLTPSQPEFLPR